MRPWTQRPFLSIDCETTGVNPFEDRLVEVAATIVRPDGALDLQWSTVVNPGIDIPDSAAEIHGITTERALAEGIPTLDAVQRVAELIFDFAYGTEGMPVCIYNAVFDWPLLICEAERHGLEFPAFAPILDPLLIDKMVDRYRKGSRKLVDTARHYGVQLDVDDAHGALADAVASGRIMHELLRRYPKVGEHTLADVYMRQVRGAEEQRESFVDYRRRTSDPSFDKPPGWPVPAGVSA
jgi:DNA polymerase-3 subunit epsilon